MKRLLTLILYALCWQSVLGQINEDANCSPGVYAPPAGYTPNPALIRSTFKYYVYYNDGRQNWCTGALVNQVVGGKPRQLFVTARHCIRDGSDGQGNLVNLNRMDFLFNFQSRNGNNDAIPVDAAFRLGNVGDIPNSNQLEPRFRYIFRSPVSLLYESTALFGSGYGIDIAMLEIQRPIPPHFNVHYAGWKSDGLLGPGGVLNAPMTIIHHPAGDAKKYAVANVISKTENSVATGCRIATKAIDFVIRLFGGRSITETVCGWVDIPQYTVPLLATGGIRGGSSGSPFFTNGNRLFAVTSGAVGQCVNVFPFFGKFRNAYANRTMRDRLNPNYNNLANIFGYDGRDIGCYPDNPLRLSGEYFPASDYQPTNAITISAQQNIEAGQVDFDQARGITAFVNYNATTGVAETPAGGADYEERRLRIYNGADFTFTAGEQIRLLPGFTVDAGASFTAHIQNCNANFRKGADDPVEEAKALLSQVVLPTPTERAEEKPRLALSPNPSGDQVACEYWVRQPGAVQIGVFDEQGRQVSTLLQAANEQPGPYRIERSIRDLEPGTYIVQMKSQNYSESKRLLVQR